MPIGIIIFHDIITAETVKMVFYRKVKL